MLFLLLRCHLMKTRCFSKCFDKYLIYEEIRQDNSNTICSQKKLFSNI